MVQQYITDETGKKLAVILPVEKYEKMLEDLEEMDKITKSPKNSPALPNHTLTDDELLEVIFDSKEQIKNGNSYTMEEMKQRITSWKNK